MKKKPDETDMKQPGEQQPAAETKEKAAQEAEEKPTEEEAKAEPETVVEQAEHNEAGAEEAPEEKPEEKAEVPAPKSEKAEDPEKETPAAESVPDDNAQLRADLLSANCKLAAYAAGVRPDMIADAVTLATAQAQSTGEVTEEAVTKTMGEVIKRHPEWAQESGPAKKKTGGFRLGADPDASAGRKSGKTENTEKKRWNRFK